MASMSVSSMAASAQLGIRSGLLVQHSEDASGTRAWRLWDSLLHDAIRPRCAHRGWPQLRHRGRWSERGKAARK